MHEGREISYKYVSKNTKTRLETKNIKINCMPLFTIYSNIRAITKEFNRVQVEVSKIYLYELPSTLNYDTLMPPLVLH
jgi:translation initiation factor 2 beta subunit (eIF-2beta)/eIF-5